MRRAELEQSLAELRRELDQLGPQAAATRARVHALIDEIEMQLDTSDSEATPASLLETLRGEIDRFEVEHPRVTNILNDIMVTLSNIGI